MLNENVYIIEKSRLHEKCNIRTRF